MAIEVNGKMLEVDEEGYLLNFDEWEPAVAEVMAKQDEHQVRCRSLGNHQLAARIFH